MENRYYQPTAERAARVRDLFDTIAARYDLLNDLQSFGLHRLWKRRLVKFASIGPGQRALDVCCGTGDVTLRLAKEGASVVGVDFSPRMLQWAQKRLERQRRSRNDLGPVEFIEADAQRLPFPDESFDAVTIAYGLRNLPDPIQGLEEMFRVTKEGGRVVVLDFAVPEGPIWRRLYLGYLRLWIPVLGWLVARDWEAYAYIVVSLLHFPSPSTLCAAMQRFGAQTISLKSPLWGGMTLLCGVKEKTGLLQKGKGMGF